ncbi:hypothetical protein BC834DRAFT_459356 [Gloeopeniophorella convolvens]|nr:hypothetical protein BC834DRAFT_459356 [Gloeopeniophorella convolvens]
MRSTGNLSIRSASDRLSVIQANSERESIRSSVGQPSRFSRAPHRQFGRGPSRSNERDGPQSRSPSPSRHPPVHLPPAYQPQPPRLEINIDHLHHPARGGSALDLPSAVSTTDGQLSPPTIRRNQRRQSSTSVVVGIENPSTESLPLSPSSRLEPFTEEPNVIDTPTAVSSPDSVITESIRERASQMSRPLSQISDFYLPEGRFIALIQSDQVPRYSEKHKIPRTEVSYTIDPLTTFFPYFSERNTLDQDSARQESGSWIPATHPDGALYFYDPDRRLFTDTDMHKPELKEEIEEFYDYLVKTIRVENMHIPSANYDLVLDIAPTDDDRIAWSYYYACHDARCLFWLEPYDASYMVSELFGVTSPAHVKHRLEALYWTHWSLYPVVWEHRRLKTEVYDELIGVLAHGCIDVMTSKSSTLPYDDDDMQKMIRLVRKAKGAHNGGEVYFTAGVTRLLSFFAHWRFLYFHGQRSARLDRHQTIYNGTRRERSLLITMLSPLLFLAPEVHLQEMEKLWTDEVIIETVWKSFMNKLLGEWEELILWVRLYVTAIHPWGHPHQQ